MDSSFMQCAGLWVGLAVWRRRQREFLQVLHVNTQLLLLLLLLLTMQCASSTAEPWWRQAVRVRRLTERHLRPGTSSSAAVASSRRRQHEVDGKWKYDGGVLFSGDLRHGLEVAQLQRVSRFVNDVRCFFERVGRFLLAFRRYNLHAVQYTQHILITPSVSAWPLYAVPHPGRLELAHRNEVGSHDSRYGKPIFN